MSNKKKPTPQRKETYEELRADMIAAHGEVMWRVMDSYIHSPLISEITRRKKSKVTTAKQIVNSIPDEDED